MVLGHESSGIVDDCGSDVITLKIGDRVALEPGDECHTCHFCRKGKYNLCKFMKFAATPPYDGTLSTFYCLPEDFCSFEGGALEEPLSVAIHCLKQTNISPTTSVVIFGAGTIDLLCCAVARTFGASTILAIDINESRLAFAEEYAATDVHRMQQGSHAENAAKILSSFEIGEGVDVIVEATGAESCISCGVSLMKRGGVFVQAGLGQSTIAFPVGEICSKEGVFKGSFVTGRGIMKLRLSCCGLGKLKLIALSHTSIDLKEQKMLSRRYRSRLESSRLYMGLDLRDFRRPCVI